MQIEAELQVLDEPVRPVTATGLTAQTDLTGSENGLTDQTAENTNSAVRGAEYQDWRVPIIFYL